MQNKEKIMEKKIYVIQKFNDVITCFVTWDDTPENRAKLIEWNEFGFEETQDIYVQAYDGKFYLQGLEPTEPEPSYQELRAEAYPDFKEYLDAMVKINSDNEILIAEGQTQLQKYYDDCLVVKNKYPKE